MVAVRRDAEISPDARSKGYSGVRVGPTRRPVAGWSQPGDVSESTDDHESTEIRQQGFVHSALLYRSEREYVDFVVRFVVDGFAVDEPVLVAVPGDRLALLGLGCVARCGIRAGLRLIDITEVARNPSRFLAMESSFAEEYPGRRCGLSASSSGLAVPPMSVWPCMQHEALVNRGFGNRE